MGALLDYAYLKNFDDKLEKLKDLAMEEVWNFTEPPQGEKPIPPLPILRNYIFHTFEKVQEEGKISEHEGRSLFNTGLVTDHQEVIYGIFSKNWIPGKQPWFLDGWRKESDRDLSAFKLPENANYFDDPSELLYDTRLELRVNKEHILDENRKRFPVELKERSDHELVNLLEGAVNDAVRRVKINYKTAVPQYYRGKIQLLLPICLTDKAKADFALVVEREGEVYRGSTCLTLDMAINNARLLARLDGEWLKY